MEEIHKLSELACEVCHVGSPTVTEDEMAMYMPQLPEWKLVEREGVNRLERGFRFADFAAALAFTNQVGRIAEEEGHHPTILTQWGRVAVSWYTHKIKGLHRNDFVMAARTDRLYQQRAGEEGARH